MLTKADIKFVRSLADKTVRQAEGLFVAEGEKLVDELLASDFRVRQLYRVGENLSPAEMNRLSFLHTPTPVLALAEISSPSAPSSVLQGLGLLLDGVQDPGNLGTILRLADWFGVRQVWCSPQTADCWSPKVVQATMGAVLRVGVHYGPLEEALSAAEAAQVPIYGTFLEGESIYTADIQPDCGLIIMGNEGRGISPATAARVTRKLYIPPYPSTQVAGSESLNVAMAAGIILSEFRRR